MSYENLKGDIGYSSGEYVTTADSETSSQLALTTANVGIGVNSPLKKLDVAGDVLIRGDGWGPGEDAVLTLGDSGQYIRSVYAGGLRLGTYLAPDGIVLQEQTGNVGIGNTNPGEKLDVSGNIKTSGMVMLGQIQIKTGFGVPNNSDGAPQGSMYLRQDGSTGTTLYVKTSSTTWTAK